MTSEEAPGLTLPTRRQTGALAVVNRARAHLLVGGGLESYLKQSLKGAVDPGQTEV